MSCDESKTTCDMGAVYGSSRLGNALGGNASKQGVSDTLEV